MPPPIAAAVARDAEDAGDHQHRTAIGTGGRHHARRLSGAAASQAGAAAEAARTAARCTTRWSSRGRSTARTGWPSISASRGSRSSAFTATARSRSGPRRSPGFKSGKYRVLVATDIAARGIDVTALGHVVNFDVPLVPEDYIHRVGRTARAETTGSAFTLVSPEEEGSLRAIERAISSRLPRVTLPDFDYNARRSAPRPAPPRPRATHRRPRTATARARWRRTAAIAAPQQRPTGRTRRAARAMSGPAYPAAPRSSRRRSRALRASRADAQRRGRDGASRPRPTPTRSRRSSTRRSGRACAAKRATSRRSRSRSCRRTRRRIRCCSSGRCRSCPAALVKVAPAVERPGIHLGVCRDGDALCGLGHRPRDSVLCASSSKSTAPGLLVVKHHRGDEAGKFVNVAVLEGDQIKIVDERASSLPDCPPLLTSLLGFDSPASCGIDSVNVLVQLAVSMRAHGRGGLLLVVPAGERRLAGIDRPSDSVRGVAAVRRPRASWRASAADDRRRAPWQDALTARWKRSPDSRRSTARRCMTTRVRCCSRSARRSRGGRARRRSSRWPSPNRSRAASQRSCTRRSLAARVICRPRSSFTISVTRSCWWRPRMAASRCLPGRRARTWSTRTGSRCCCCDRQKLKKSNRSMPARSTRRKGEREISVCASENVARSRRMRDR